RKDCGFPVEIQDTFLADGAWEVNQPAESERSHHPFQSTALGPFPNYDAAKWLALALKRPAGLQKIRQALLANEPAHRQNQRSFTRRAAAIWSEFRRVDSVIREVD